MQRPKNPSSGPEKIGAILESLAESPELPQDVRDAIRAGLTKTRYTPHMGCPCGRCARAYGIIP